MPTIFYEIFNNWKKLSTKVLKELINEVLKKFEELKKSNDIDNLKILKNKLEAIEQKNKKKLHKQEKKELNSIIDDISDFIEKTEKEKLKEEQPQIVDVVKQVEKRYKKCEKLSAEKLKKYTPTCRKTATIEYEKELALLQLELAKLQKHIKETWEKTLNIDGKTVSF